MKTGWFAFIADSDDLPYPEWDFAWRPYVQLDSGCFPLPIWFKSEADCENFIEQNLVGLGVLPS